MTDTFDRTDTSKARECLEEARVCRRLARHAEHALLGLDAEQLRDDAEQWEQQARAYLPTPPFPKGSHAS